MPAPGTVGVLRPVRRGPLRWERLTPNPPSSLQPSRGRTSPAIHETGNGNSRHEFQLRVMSSNKRSTHTPQSQFPSPTRAYAQSTGFHHYDMIQANTKSIATQYGKSIKQALQDKGKSHARTTCTAPTHKPGPSPSYHFSPQLPLHAVERRDHSEACQAAHSSCVQRRRSSCSPLRPQLCSVCVHAPEPELLPVFLQESAASKEEPNRFG